MRRIQASLEQSFGRHNYKSFDVKSSYKNLSSKESKHEKPKKPNRKIYSKQCSQKCLMPLSTVLAILTFVLVLVPWCCHNHVKEVITNL